MFFYCLILVSSLLLLLSQLEVLRPLDNQLLLSLALLAFQPEDDFPGGLRFFVEDGFGLTAEAHLLGVVAALSLGEVGGFAGFVLGDFVELVFAALLAFAVGLALFGDVDHFE